MKPRYEYEYGYKNYGAWYGYIPPRHKKRLKNHCKKKNQGKRKEHPLYIKWEHLIEIGPFITRVYA